MYHPPHLLPSLTPSLEKVDYLNRENFKLLDKLLYISRKEGKLSRGALKNKKYRHNTLNTQFRRRWHEDVIRENISL